VQIHLHAPALETLISPATTGYGAPHAWKSHSALQVLIPMPEL
jgi:hypothetical protein